MDNFKVTNFGPILNADINFGDLTILIGPQASGKSLFLELFKLVKDRLHIISTLRSYNYILGKEKDPALLEYYFGEGLSALVRDNTRTLLNGHDETRNLTDSISNASGTPAESVFYVPAQRILSIADGRPKNFMEFDLSTPYILRYFSETLRVFLQGGLGNPDILFPMKLRLENGIRESLNDSIFHDGKVIIDPSGGQRKMKMLVDGVKLPFMTWSAGQKEFMPLLLAVYCLTGPQTPVVNREGYKWVIIEEPEMGLHPRAIESVIIEIIELMQSGYKVIISTHSSLFLDFAWSVRELGNLEESTFKDALCRLFDLSTESKIKNLFNGLKGRTINSYYFDPSHGGVNVVDISSLNVMSPDTVVSEWGGLSSFASRASAIVSEYGEE